jgi:hypothetical protein
VSRSAVRPESANAAGYVSTHTTETTNCHHAPQGRRRAAPVMITTDGPTRALISPGESIA